MTAVILVAVVAVTLLLISPAFWPGGIFSRRRHAVWWSGIVRADNKRRGRRRTSVKRNRR